ncbi:hypothetical protein [Embleya hyalina]|nr:hypothetical protein [Embleya hyalina]
MRCGVGTAEVPCDGNDRFVRVVVSRGDVSLGVLYLGKQRPGCS